jgi:hypothetical protein
MTLNTDLHYGGYHTKLVPFEVQKISMLKEP